MNEIAENQVALHYNCEYTFSNMAAITKNSAFGLLMQSSSNVVWKDAK